MLILVCNAGSTSLKYKLFKMPEEKVLSTGKIERIGDAKKGIYAFKNCVTGEEKNADGIDIMTYTDGINLYLSDLAGEGKVISSISELSAVGFKTVVAKGYYGVHIITDDVMDAMKEYIDIAPAHNTFYIEAINTFRKILPDTTMVGVFETNFHRTIPDYARIYATPYEWYEKDGICRLGFHGASHGYIAYRTTQMFGEGKKVISCHLGGSSSICAIKDGKSVETSFGMSLQTGLPHSNRVGDMDAFAIVRQLSLGKSMKEIEHALNKESGLLGISGVSKDMRDIDKAAKEGNKRAALAIDFFCHEVKKFIGAYAASMGGVDYIVFTAGIGEKSVSVREKSLSGLEFLGVVLDKEKNASGEAEREISSFDSKVKVFIIPTDEEIIVARQTFSTVN
ncbi:MAG: acetate/propionate family kinase [Lachnospiraceae bacterium]|nr:acetate/propionate family kinase [Lachnospiraceae bacterium]